MKKHYINENLAPIAPDKRKWSAFNFFTLWWGMSLNIPTYMLASSLLVFRSNIVDILFAVFIGNIIILMAVLLNGHIGAKYGISFPVLARVSFGIKGATIVTIIRAFVACGWFGIQSWIGGLAIEQLMNAAMPETILKLKEFFDTKIMFYFVFVLINLVVVYKGMNFLKRILAFHTLIFFILTMFLIGWVYAHINFSELSQMEKILSRNIPEQKDFLFIVNNVVCGFAAICVNITDYTRFAKSSRSQLLGQLVALPFAKTYVALVGILVTYLYFTNFQVVIWNPIGLLDYLPNKMLLIMISFAIIFATLISNITLNAISAANDFSNIFPNSISFRKGIILTCLLSFLMQPWKIMATANHYVSIWLSGISIGLAPIISIIIVDYYFIKKKHINVNSLFTKNDLYWYKNGINPQAFLAFTVAISFNIIGFAAKNYLDGLSDCFIAIYDLSWFFGFFISGILYYMLNIKNQLIKNFIENIVILMKYKIFKT